MRMTELTDKAPIPRGTPIKMKKQRQPYNKRLFGKGIRGWAHRARFRWLSRKVRQYGSAPYSVVELGCYDAKSITFLDSLPQAYLGLDANWESGLDLARKRWAGHPEFEFIQCRSPEALESSAGANISQRTGKYNIALCMETLEHLPEHLVGPYLRLLRQLTDGYVFITVPVEIGPVFLIKYLVKRIITRDGEKYRLREILCAALGLSRHVERNQHKGFDWRRLREEVGAVFDIVEVSGMPFSPLPPMLNFGVGIVARTPDSQSDLQKPGTSSSPD